MEEVAGQEAQAHVTADEAHRLWLGGELSVVVGHGLEKDGSRDGAAAAAAVLDPACDAVGIVTEAEQ